MDQQPDPKADDFYSLCPFLDEVLLEDDENEIEEGLKALSVFIGKNKPQPKLIEDEVLHRVPQMHEKYVKAGSKEPILDILKRVLVCYENLRKNNGNNLAIRTFSRMPSILKETYPDDFLTQTRQYAIENWKRIDGINLRHYIHCFGIEDDINGEELVLPITDLFNNKKFTEAVGYINTLKLHDKFVIPDLISKLLHQDKFNEASSLVSGSKEQQILLIKQMCTNKHASKAADLVKQFHL